MIVCYDWCLLLSLSSLLAGALFLLSSSLFTRAAVITCDYLHSVPPAGLFTRMQLSVALKPLHCSVPAPSPCPWCCCFIPLFALCRFPLVYRPLKPSYFQWYLFISLPVLYFSCHYVIGFSVFFILKEKNSVKRQKI